MRFTFNDRSNPDDDSMGIQIVKVLAIELICNYFLWMESKESLGGTPEVGLSFGVAGPPALTQTAFQTFHPTGTTKVCHTAGGQELLFEKSRSKSLDHTELVVRFFGSKHVCSGNNER